MPYIKYSGSQRVDDPPQSSTTLTPSQNHQLYQRRKSCPEITATAAVVSADPRPAPSADCGSVGLSQRQRYLSSRSRYNALQAASRELSTATGFQGKAAGEQNNQTANHVKFGLPAHE